MKRGGLFLIGIISAVATIISLNAAFGRPGYFDENYHARYSWHHRCYGRDDYDNHYRNDRKNPDQQKQQDSATGKY